MQQLQDTGKALRGLLTYSTPSQEVKLIDAPGLTVDNVKLPLASRTTFAEAKEPLSLIIVLQLAGRTKDREAFPALRRGLTHLVKVVSTLSEARIGLLGYNVTPAEYQPNVPLGAASQLPAVVQALQLPNIRPTLFELHDALAQAVTRLEREPRARRKLIVVYTDGGEKLYDPTQLFQQLTARANKADIVVSAIMLPTKEPNDFLRALVDGTGGLIRRSGDVSALGTAFDTTGTELTGQTVATFQSDGIAHGGGPSVQKVQVTDRTLTLKASWPIDWQTPPEGDTKPGMPEKPVVAPSGSPVRWLRLGLLGMVVLLGSVLLIFWRRGLWPSRAVPPPPLPTLPPTLILRPAEAPAEPTLSPPSPVSRPAQPSAVCWLYEVRRQRTHLVDRFPFKVGNDLDCDLVLGGLSEPVTIVTLSSDGRNFYLQLQCAGRQSFPRRVRRAVLSDRTEFAVGAHRLVIFETPLTD